MAKLIELLTTKEIDQIIVTKDSILRGIDMDKDAGDLTINELNALSFLLIRTEYGSIMPKCILGAEAITILTRRAKARHLFI